MNDSFEIILIQIDMETITDQKNEVTKSFIICKRGDVYIPVKTGDIFLFFYQVGTCFAVDKSDNKYIVDRSLSELEQMLDRNSFFRANRRIIINIHCIKEFKSIDFGKILIQLKNADSYKQDIVISQINAPLFKQWIYNL
jgi:DNA-binding LytR/AlgR family response regulator